MQYFGGKYRIAKEISIILKQVRKPNQIYLEPFVGSANVIVKLDNPRIGSDYHKDLIMLLKAVQDRSFIFPDSITVEDYYNIKNQESSALRAFVGFGCSFSGKWFGGYARSKNRNYCLNAKNSLLKKSLHFDGIEFIEKDYRDWNTSDYLIYCDPPYEYHTQIHGDDFNHAEFWELMRAWSEKNAVIISEYQAPPDFICFKEIKTKTDISCKTGKQYRVEKLFTHNSHHALASSISF